MKRCRVCGESKSLDDFYRRQGGRDGHRNDCKSCVSDRASHWQSVNREKRNERLARWRERHRERLREYSMNWRTAHPERAREIHEAWRVANPQKLAEWSHAARLKRYGLTDEQFWSLLASQDYSCAICRVPFEAGRYNRVHIDHDHACCPAGGSCGECVRGMLCRSCNQGLGLLDDDPARLRAAADYLERHAAGDLTRTTAA